MLLSMSTPSIVISNTPVSWIKRNLFNSVLNTILTIGCLIVMGWCATRLGNWMFTQAEWSSVTDNLRLLLVGRYPVQLLWRIWIVVAVLSSLIGFSWGVLASGRWLNRGILMALAACAAIAFALAPWIGLDSTAKWIGILALWIVGAASGWQLVKKLPALRSGLTPIWFASFFILLWLIEGGLGLRTVRRDDLSGLLLTILAAIAGIGLSFPFGILLALGRQSTLPVIRWLSIAYIEIIRGLPLVSIIFMSQVMLPFVLPAGSRPERVTRGIVGLTLFSIAVLAENVRGGLQSIPRGQYEAAKSLGLNAPLSMGLIILPQALRAVIPTIVGQFISLFKDTSLLAIAGLSELLGMGQTILANPKYIGRNEEVYFVIAVIYWGFCFLMSWGSRRLEKSNL
jgi:general L-amino acid transport system permease protein